MSISGFRSWFQDLNRPAGTQGQISSHHNIEKWYRNWRCFFRLTRLCRPKGRLWWVLEARDLTSHWWTSLLHLRTSLVFHEPGKNGSHHIRTKKHENLHEKHGRNNVRNQQATTQELDMWHVSSSRNEAKFSPWSDETWNSLAPAWPCRTSSLTLRSRLFWGFHAVPAEWQGSPALHRRWIQEPHLHKISRRTSMGTNTSKLKIFCHPLI